MLEKFELSHYFRGQEPTKERGISVTLSYFENLFSTWGVVFVKRTDVLLWPVISKLASSTSFVPTSFDVVPNDESQVVGIQAARRWSENLIMANKELKVKSLLKI